LSSIILENPLPFKGRDRPVLREVEGVEMGFSVPPCMIFALALRYYNILLWVL